MEHSVTFTTKDGTEYRLAYDNETGDRERMHYLLHEDGVLKLECSHHKLPDNLTEEEFKSVVVPLAFLNCLGRTLNDMAVRREAAESGDELAATMAQLIRPHVALEPDQLDYVRSILERGHSIELFVQLQQELQIEQFARQLNAEPAQPKRDGTEEDVPVEAQVSDDGGRTFRAATSEELEQLGSLLFPRKRSLPKWVAPAAFALLVVAVYIAWILTFGVN